MTTARDCRRRRLSPETVRSMDEFARLLPKPYELAEHLATKTYYVIYVDPRTGEASRLVQN